MPKTISFSKYDYAENQQGVNYSSKNSSTSKTVYQKPTMKKSELDNLLNSSSNLLSHSTYSKPPVITNTPVNNNRTLWVGDLEKAAAAVTVDESYVTYHMFYEFWRNISRVKVCRDKLTGVPCYAFIEFNKHDIAQYCLENLSNKWVPGRLHKYKLNWATFNVSESNNPVGLVGSSTTRKRAATTNPTEYEQSCKRQDTAGARANVPTYSVWVGSMDPATTQGEVEELFSKKYDSVAYAKIIIDPVTNLGRGFAFVHFYEEGDSEKALYEMNGAVCRGRRLKINRANNNSNKPAIVMDPKGNPNDKYAQSAFNKMYDASIYSAQKIAKQCGYVCTKSHKQFNNNVGLGQFLGTRVLVKGIDTFVCDEVIHKHFEGFGEILHVKVMHDKGRSFIDFFEREAAINSINSMNGAYIGGSRISIELYGEEGNEGVEAVNNLSGNNNINNQIGNFAALGNTTEYYVNYGAEGVVGWSGYDQGNNGYYYDQTSSISYVLDPTSGLLVPTNLTHQMDINNQPIINNDTNYTLMYTPSMIDDETIYGVKDPIQIADPKLLPPEHLCNFYENPVDSMQLDNYNTFMLQYPILGKHSTDTRVKAYERAKLSTKRKIFEQGQQKGFPDIETLCETYTSDYYALVY